MNRYRDRGMHYGWKHTMTEGYVDGLIIKLWYEKVK